jgi:hypothetical protein
MRFLGGKEVFFEKLSNGSKTSDMTSEGLGEVFEGDSADNGQACADGERGPPSARAEIFQPLLIVKPLICTQPKYHSSITSIVSFPFPQKGNNTIEVIL